MRRRPAFTLPHFRLPRFTPPDFGQAINFEFLRAFPQAPWRTQTQAVSSQVPAPRSRVVQIFDARWRPQR